MVQEWAATAGEGFKQKDSIAEQGTCGSDKQAHKEGRREQKDGMLYNNLF